MTNDYLEHFSTMRNLTSLSLYPSYEWYGDFTEGIRYIGSMRQLVKLELCNE